MKNVLVTGGAGYIGAHAVRALYAAGYGVRVYDNFSRGHREAVEEYRVIEGDTGDRDKLARVMAEEKIGAVMHFAAHSQVGESVEKPALYYENNVCGTISLLGAMLDAGVKRIVFSSSAAVYGEPQTVPIGEDEPLKPANPYGETKAVIEQALQHYGRAYGIKTVSLRYFNAAGAAEDGQIGEKHDPETHLIPLVLEAILKRRGELTVFGSDYPTADGTAVRDYIHVEDLAGAHILALEALDRESAAGAYNLGVGRGYSVLEVIRAAERVSGKKVPYRFGARRPGDPAVLVASPEKAFAGLGWKPRFTELDPIVESAWRWHSRL